jgi:hypothetical protein
MYYSFPGTFTVDQGNPQVIVRDPVIDGGLYRMVKKCDAVFPVLNLKPRTYARRNMTRPTAAISPDFPESKTTHRSLTPHTKIINNPMRGT